MVNIYDHKKALKANDNKAYTPISVMPDRPLYDKYAKGYLPLRALSYPCPWQQARQPHRVVPQLHPIKK